ncbi:deubiquitinase OTUD6B isoform X2 [Dendroctonus ponderosae]|uniref:deubiquitinase OTUD6B isoform X2 n=1 Tax=Dendroctonus ponderosae TaxID=77166 RepID=UPI002035A5CB|nr:deubiquitinase OTUD6B isoform X2 [Dendroctonus ponderosae]
MESSQGELGPVNMDELVRRQRQEKKDLQNKTQSMKKSIPKGDKKKKKTVSEEIAKLEKDLDDKHAQELEDHSNQEAETVLPKISRAQKRRNKKDTEARERERYISEEAEKNRDGVRSIEMNSIKKSLGDINLQIFNINANGNCLYLAVKHQLQTLGKPSYSVPELRQKTANYMLTNKEDFLPFMCNEDDEFETVSEEAFESYCKEVETTKVWGGQLELKALSNILSCPIKVIQATGPPTIQGENFEGPELILTYHRHLYKLGEHYNSTLPLEQDADSS